MRMIPDAWFEPRPWVAGEWQTTADSFAVTDPATGRTLADVGRADAALVDRACAAAVAVLPDWSHASPFARGQVLTRCAALMTARRDALARLITAEQGKPLAQARAEVDYAVSFFQWFGEEARRVHGRLASHPEADREFVIERRAAGVAGLVTPWNFPLAQAAKKVAAALAAGCTAVWKPAEATPLVALGLVPLLVEAGMPPAVLAVVPGRGSEVGPVLAAHPAVRVLSLTGSTATGRSLMVAAAAGIKRVSLELGGNAPFIVLPDADPDFVADQLVRLKLFVSGQVCVTANRVFVPAGLEAALVTRLADRLLAARVGNGMAEGVDAGPLIHARACVDVGSLVREAVADGAELVCANHGFEADADLRHGSFFPPTLLCGVTDGMRIAREEIFGPVISLLRYDRPAAAVARANATPAGLAGYVYGADLAACRAVAAALDVGIVGVNEWRPLKAEIPFGGVKESGIGAEGGTEGIGEFLDTRVISLPRPRLPA
jgi:succinate-semialdehyde dehydrogenase/glutarate-semialdehyde dehydrogenase